MLAGFPEEIEEYIIPPEEKCDICGGEMKVIEKTCVSASNNDVDIITEKLLCCTTPCFEALTERNDKKWSHGEKFEMSKNTVNIRGSRLLRLMETCR